MLGMYHEPVLLREAVDALNIRKDSKYIDCSLGGGGHTAEILNRGGIVLGFDVDKNAIEFCKARFEKEIANGKLIIVKRNFDEIDSVVDEIGWKQGEISGILYDLGLSTFQIKGEKKGFSFEDKSDFDMRMDDSLSVSAHDLLAVLSEKELEKLFLTFGEEPQSRKYAKVLKDVIKKSKKKMTAFEISELIQKSSKYSHSRIHPATRVFQAFRIAVNSELENLRQSVGKATPLLHHNGRLVIISFHALEDKIAKSLAGSPDRWLAIKSPTTPSDEELKRNPSSRSAKMRIYERI